MKKLIRLLAALVLAFILLLFLVTPALAIPNPDSGPTIESVSIYRHTLETDDTLIVVQYYLDYTTNPSETINQAFFGRFMSADGSELANVAPYAYYDKGYDHGIFSMYLDASYVSYWNTGCTVRFEGNPMLDWAGTPPSTTTSTLNWHATSTSQATRLLLGSDIIQIANSLSNYWSVALTTETAIGTLLSSYGEQYFTNAIPNLRTMCPNIFSGGVVAPVYEEKEFTKSYRDTLLGRWDGTMTGNALQGLSDWTTIPLTVVKGFLWFIPVCIIAYYTAMAVKDLRPALFLVLLTLPLGNLLGMLSLTLTMVVALFCILALGFALFYRPASG